MKIAFSILMSILLALISLPLMPGKAYAETGTSHKIASDAGYMNRYKNGAKDDYFQESVLGVDGNLAFCVNPHKLFKAGPVTSASILSIMDQQTLTKIALYIHYMRDVYNSVNLPENARNLMAQCLIWEALYSDVYYEVSGSDEGGTYPELTKQVRDSALSSAKQYASDNAWRYEGYGTLWKNGTTQDVATFGIRSIVGKIDLQKESISPSITDSNPNYSLESAVYGVYRNPECTDRATSLTTNSEGYAISGDLVRGTYYVKETTAPSGYELDGKTYTVTVAPEATSRVNGSRVYDNPLCSNMFIEISKFDSETKWGESNAASGSASLGGAQYRVNYYKDQHGSVSAAESSGAPVRTWTFATDADGKCDLSKASPVDGDALFKNGSENNVYPLGTYVIFEVAPPVGYLPSEKKYLINARQEGKSVALSGDTHVEDGHTYVRDSEQVRRGDLKLNKVRESDMKRLANVPFKLTSETTGESHVISTDENGFIDTSSNWNKHTLNTNENDNALKEDGSVDEGKLRSECGIWFKGREDGERSDPKDDMGALPYDSYTLEELPCSNNDNLTLVKIKGIAISRDGACIDLGTVADLAAQTVSISTAARDAESGGKTASASASTTIIDKVSYMNAIAGERYELAGTLYDKATESPILDADGNEVQQRISFTPDTPNGYAELEFNFDARTLAGSEIVVFEQLLKDGVVVASHEDIDDFDQAVGISTPSISTSAEDAADEDKDLTANPTSKITDTVTYSNLEIGGEYELFAQIVDKDTGEALASATKDFTPESPSGQVDVELELNTADLAGKAVVVFEELHLDGTTMASHEDIEDTEQTLNIVPMQISTLAVDAADGNKVILADSEAVIKDTVTYQNAISGHTYKVYGVLVDPDAKQEISISGDEGDQTVEASTEFTATSGSGQVELTYEFDARGLEDTRATSFAYISEVGEDGDASDIACSETDYECAEQTVEFVSSNIKSYATDATDGDKLLLNSRSASVTDTISYTNLVPGKEYMLVGKLMDKQTEDVLYVNDKPVTTTTAFTPNNPTGTVDVQFDFDASELKDKELVVYEELYRDMEVGEDDSKSVLVATHEDIDDEKQTVRFENVETPDVDVREEPDAPEETPAPASKALAQTGDGNLPIVTLALICCTAFAAIAAIAWRRGRTSQRRERQRQRR